MDKLIKTLPAILSASGAAEELAEAACMAAWKATVGETLSIHTAPLQLKDKTLIIAVADNIWKKQLEQMRGQLLFRVNSMLGQKLLTSIEFQVDASKLKLMGGADAKRKDNAAETSAIPIELVSAAAVIQDPGLRRAFLGAAVSCVKRLEIYIEPCR